MLVTLQGYVYAFGLRGDGMLGIEASLLHPGQHITDAVVFKVRYICSCIIILATVSLVMNFQL